MLKDQRSVVLEGGKRYTHYSRTVELPVVRIAGFGGPLEGAIGVVKHANIGTTPLRHLVSIPTRGMVVSVVVPDDYLVRFFQQQMVELPPAYSNDGAVCRLQVHRVHVRTSNGQFGRLVSMDLGAGPDVKNPACKIVLDDDSGPSRPFKSDMLVPFHADDLVQRQYSSCRGNDDLPWVCMCV